MATFSASAGSLSITLTNLQANPADVAQALSDLSFTVSSGATTGAVLTNASAQEITVFGNGAFNLGANLISPAAVGWVNSSNGATGLVLDVLAGGGAGPAHLIIGPPGAGGYSNANGSIAGNSAHNPFLNQAVTFVIFGPDLTTASIPNSVTFSFGTTEGANNVPGVSTVPVPAALPLFATGLGALGLLGWRRKRKARAAAA
jgi:hypothetical protein